MKKILLILLLIPMQAYAVTVPPVSTSSYDILSDLNIYRAKYDLTPLEKNDTLCELAEKRVEQIKTDWSHGQFQPEIDKISNMDGVFSENLARTFEPGDVVWAWSMSQAGHREAMLVPNMKYGCVIQSGDRYVFEGYTPN
jgi:uncharacterized protein YkwD